LAGGRIPFEQLDRLSVYGFTPKVTTENGRRQNYFKHYLKKLATNGYNRTRLPMRSSEASRLPLLPVNEESPSPAVEKARRLQ
jgi:hypothetical protein